MAAINHPLVGDNLYGTTHEENAKSSFTPCKSAAGDFEAHSMPEWLESLGFEASTLLLESSFVTYYTCA